MLQACATRECTRTQMACGGQGPGLRAPVAGCKAGRVDWLLPDLGLAARRSYLATKGPVGWYEKVGRVAFSDALVLRSSDSVCRSGYLFQGQTKEPKQRFVRSATDASMNQSAYKILATRIFLLLNVCYPKSTTSRRGSELPTRHKAIQSVITLVGFGHWLSVGQPCLQAAAGGARGALSWRCIWLELARLCWQKHR